MDGVDHLLAAQQMLTVNDDGSMTETEYAVFNDPEILEPMFASGQIHEGLRDKLLEEPLWVGTTDGAAKRFMNYQNDQRAANGQFVTYGFTKLRKRTLTRTPWQPVEGAELDDIDDGRRPYG